MNKISLIFLAIFCFSYGLFKLTEDEAIARIDRIAYFALYQLFNPKNMLADGSCCGTKNDDSCEPCNFSLLIKRFDNEGKVRRFYVYQGKKPSSHFIGYTATGHNVDSKIYNAYNLVHVVDNDGVGDLEDKIYDTWKGVDAKVVGVYPMNGVYGESFKSLLFGAWSVTAPLPNMAYYSMIFTIRNIEWIYTPQPSDSICPKATPFKISALVGMESVWSSQVHAYDGTNCSYPVKYTGGTNSAVILKENAVLTLNFNDVTADALLIDSIVIDKINTDDRKRSLEFLKNVGKNGKIKIDVDVKYNCIGYVGKNCIFPCQPIDEITECKPEDGIRYCKNGANDLNSCSDFTNTCHANPCANGAKCTAFRTGYFCNCTEGWAGRDCRDSICQQTCFKGQCGANNSCSCIEGYGGRWCESTSCINAEASKCKNGGICMRIRDSPTCICPLFASGYDCSKLNCNPLCKMGQCEITPNSNPASVQCKCVSGFKGKACEILIYAPSIFNPSNYIYAISGLSIAFALLVKIMIVLFLIPNLFRMEKPEEPQALNPDATIA